MDRVKKFISDNYKILIPIMALLVLAITLFFLYREYKYDNYRDIREENVYQYFAGNKIEYTLNITYDLKKNIRKISPKDKKIDYDSTPIYYKDKFEVLFPQEMLVAFPLKEGGQYRTYKYSRYINDDSIHNIINGNTQGVYNYFFMYDGEELFFFPTSCELNIGSNKYTDLSGGSYVSIIDKELLYYDYQNDKSEIIDIGNKDVTVSSEYINVDLLNGSFKTLYGGVLLSRPDKLNPLYKSN